MKRKLQRVSVVLDVAGVVAVLAGTIAMLWLAAFSRTIEGDINHFWGLRFFEGGADVLQTLNLDFDPQLRGYTYYFLNNRLILIAAGLAFIAASTALRRLAEESGGGQ